jgi:NADPH:quinone reductase-like Zn-dependent oxidoreductase
MKAIVWTQYGPPDVLQLQEVATPTPKEGEVLVKIHAAGVTAGDCEMRRLQLPLGLSLPMRLYTGLFQPRRVTILGQELAGEVVALGRGVTNFAVGNQVIAASGFGFGAYAEYICLGANGDAAGDATGGTAVLAPMPPNLTSAEAATLPVGGLEALHFLQRANVRGGESLLINGAGGSIGTLALQLAKHLGAEVTAVDGPAKLALLRSLGADHVVDYTQEDFTRSGKTYDIIFDVVGKSSFSRSLGALKPHGRYLLGNPRVATLVRGWWTTRLGDKQVILATSEPRSTDLLLLAELAAAGKIKPFIDRTYPLGEAAAAHRYVESGQKAGSIALVVAS